jgi:hypothetical protein
MNEIAEQGELFALIWGPFRHPFRLRVNDVIRVDGRLCRVIRVTECAAVVIMNRPRREFTTRFDKRVRFQPSPLTFRISANTETEILNRKGDQQKKRRRRSAASSSVAAKTNGVTKNSSTTPPGERRAA